MVKYILIDSSSSTDGAFHVVRVEDGKRKMLHTGTHEDMAYAAILKDVGVVVEEYTIDDFVSSFCKGTL